MAFSGYDLMEIRLDEANKHFSTKDGALYSKDGKILLAYPAAKARELSQYVDIAIPESVEVINYGALYNMQEVTVSLGKNVRKVGANQMVKAFNVNNENPNIISVDGFILSKDSTTILSAAYFNKEYSNKLTIPSFVKKINDKVFFNQDFDTLEILATSNIDISQNTFNLNKKFVCLIPATKLETYKQKAYFKQMNLMEKKVAKNNKKTKKGKKHR